MRKRLELRASLYQILQILSLTLFEKMPILCALQAIELDANFAENANQLILFDFSPDSSELLTLGRTTWQIALPGAPT
ncbi:MAG: hypothetical protein ACYDCG_12025 [Candidatus Acidiferrales bacterium]